jgi:isoleucyl-tRNA synthetase
LTEEYKEITHNSIYFQLPIIRRENEYLLVWTTTPWTLPANIAVAVDEKIDYALVQENIGRKFWMAKELVGKIFKGENFKILKTVKGKELVGLEYTWAFDDLPRVKKIAEQNKDKFHIVVATDSLIMPITTEEGTGLVHVAVSAGEEDFQLGKKLELPLIEIIDEDATYLDGLGKFSGDNAKQRPQIILDYLRDKTFKNLPKWVFKIEDYAHRYPTCWRCKTELVWRVVDEWYISMEKLRKPLTEVAKSIKWIPDFGLERELDWLKNMQDWLISKKRYWGLALPIFECVCGHFEVIGSKEELKQRAVEGWSDFENHSPHRPWVDRVKIKCSECGKLVSRVPDVGNPWLDAGIVSFSTMKYFSDKEYWRKWFPADFICESFPGQFKNWFYSLIVMSQVLEKTNPTKTIFGFALVRDEKGEEMHKSKGNAIEFNEAAEKIGADVMRWMYVKQNPAFNLNFGWKAGEETKRKLLTLWNSFVFLNTYLDKKELFRRTVLPKTSNVLDKWILSRLNNLIEKVGRALDEYDAASASLNIRRSRRRLQKPENEKEKEEASQTLYCVLINLAKLTAPFLPFIGEELYQNLKLKKDPESVHLCDFPRPKESLIDEKLEKKMSEVREIVAQTLAERAKVNIRVRQPLPRLKIRDLRLKPDKDLIELIKEEVNVKEIIFDPKIKNEIELDVKITPELKEEGEVREVIRNLQEMRKQAGLKPKDKILIRYSTDLSFKKILERNKKTILKETLARNFSFIKESKKELKAEKEIKIGGIKLWLGIRTCQ